MLGALIIVFREAIEAGLIVGIVMAVTRGVPFAARYVAGGVGAGAMGALLVALFADRLSRAFAGSAQELSAAGRAAASGESTLLALAGVVALAILREGAEVALFLYGVLASGESGLDVFFGGLLGLALGAATSLATFYGLVKIPPKRLFGVTTALITLLAAGLAAQCVGFLQQAGVITALADTLWDSSWLLSDKSIPGRVLHTLVGYADQPSGMQVVAWLVTLIAILTATRVLAPAAPSPAPAGSAVTRAR